MDNFPPFRVMYGGTDVSGSNAFPVSDSTLAGLLAGQAAAAPVTGQVVIAATNTAVQLPSHVLANGIVIKSKTTNNAAGATVGKSDVTTTVDGTGNGYSLLPGEAASFGLNNSNALWVNGTIGDVFFFQGS